MRMLWWLGSVSAMACAVALFFDSRHLYTLFNRAKFAIESPEISGFRAPYPYCQIAKNGISPNGQLAFILGYSDEELTSNPPNCLALRSHPGEYFQLPTHIDESTSERESYDGVVRWAKDSSSVLCFTNCVHATETGVFTRGAYEIYVVSIIKGRPAKYTNIGTEILKVSHPAFAKSLEKEIKYEPVFYVSITDGGFDDNLTFNDSNQLIVNCYSSNIVRDEDRERLGESWTTHVNGLWDPSLEKFVQLSCTRITPTN
jgi:hypothetical protein